MSIYFWTGIGKLINIYGSKIIDTLLHWGQTNFDLNWPTVRSLINDLFLFK
jgi:hypothetical protein